jgi:FkbM family methyltransferase
MLLGAMNVHAILDVGAYDGETALIYRRLFPAAVIHCFEPVTDSFKRLSQAIAGDAHVVANRIALGDSIGPVQVYVNRLAATSSRFRPADRAAEIVQPEFLDAVGMDSAESMTVDEYCRQRGIGRVEILKLDIQGGELAALRGAVRMLAESRISLVYIELLVGVLYEGQGTAGELMRALEQHDYRLYGLYNLVYGRDSSLYQMDAIFISPQIRPRS